MNIKVMLVDDEILVRLGIKSLIDWDKHGFDYIGDAPDGIEALDAMRLTPPDILLTDIVMPNMNGLELIEAVRKQYPYTRIIVLSSHNEYEYVRTAMKMGVDDYILKASMKPDELLALLAETAEKVEADRRDVKQRMASEDSELAGGNPRSRDETEMCFLRGLLDGADPKEGTEETAALGLTASNAIMVLHVHPGQSSPSNGGPSSQLLLNLLELELRKWTPGHVLPYKENEYVLLVSFENNRISPDIQEELKAIGRDLASAAKRFLDVAVSVGCSECFAQAGGLLKAYEQAKRALQLYFYEGKGSVYAFTGQAENGQAAIPLSNEDASRLRQAIARSDEETARGIVDGLFGRLERKRGTIESAIRVCLELLHLLKTEWHKVDELLLDGLEEETPLFKQVLAFEELEEAKRWFERLVAECAERTRALSRGAYREEIGRLLAHIMEHVAEDWSLRRAAELVNMNESYLSYLFKKETESGFIEYVNRVRADKAAELLLTTNLPSYAIAEQVGYDNINYFGRVFKKVKGVSPQQYRSQFQPRTP